MSFHASSTSCGSQGDKDVKIGGRIDTVRQRLRAALNDDIYLAHAPVVPRAGVLQTFPARLTTSILLDGRYCAYSIETIVLVQLGGSGGNPRRHLSSRHNLRQV